MCCPNCCQQATQKATDVRIAVSVSSDWGGDPERMVAAIERRQRDILSLNRKP